MQLRMFSKMLEVKPIYGWGWSNDGEYMAVPDVFLLGIIRMDIEKRACHGIVVSQDHLLAGYEIELSARHTPETSSDDYNLTGSKTIDGVSRRVAGFAQTQF